MEETEEDPGDGERAGSPAHPGGHKAHRGLPLCCSRKAALSVSFQREEAPDPRPSLQSRVVGRGHLLTPSLPAPISYDSALPRKLTAGQPAPCPPAPR